MKPRLKVRAPTRFAIAILGHSGGITPKIRTSIGNGIRCILISLLFASVGGCAIDYYDARHGIEHVWGVGHVAMKVGSSTEGLKAVGSRTDSVGLSIGRAQEGYYLVLGWNSYQQIDVIDENTQLCLAWPAGSFYTVRVGFEFPPDITNCGREKKEKSQ